MKHLLFGCACLHASWISHSSLIFLSASVAVLLSRCAGARSILSSVMLKSPRMNLGWGILLSLLTSSIPSQNGFCVAWFVGMYTFSNEVSHVSNHFIFRSRAQPGWSSFVFSSLWFRTVLLITKATPALPVGSLGSSEVTISRFLLKHSRTCLIFSWSRCVSYKASIPILCLYIVLLMALHFCSNIMLWAIPPLMFKVAMFTFTLLDRFSLCWWCIIWCPGVGLGWCALQWWFMFPLLRLYLPQWETFFMSQLPTAGL